MGCSQPGPAATVNVPPYVPPQPGKIAITLVRYSVITTSGLLFAGVLYEGSSEPPPQSPPVIIRPGQRLKATATAKNIGGMSATFYIRGYLDIDASGLPHTFFMNAQQYGTQACEDYWLYDHMIQICFTEARVTLNPGQEISIDFVSQPLPTIRSLTGVSWEAGRFENGRYVSTDHWFRDEKSVQYQP